MQRRVASRLSACASIKLAVVVLLAGCAAPYKQPVPLVRSDQVGHVAANRFVTPTGQVLTPSGKQVSLPGMRPQALALSPDGRLLATAGRNNSLALIDPATGQVLQTIPLSVSINYSVAPVSGPITATSAARGAVTYTAELSFTGLVFSPDGRRLYLSNASGNVWVFPVNGNRVAASPSVLPVPDARAPNRKREIPTGLAVSADGNRLYVAGNLGGRLYELDAFSGTLLRSWDTGVAPYDVVLSGSKAYVSNLGGPFPRQGELTAPAGKGTTVRVDPVRFIALAGSVTVIDLTSGRISSEIATGLHTSALAVSPDGKYVVAANAGDDTLSVIDTRTDRVIEKIWARQTPADLFGAQPNALAFAPDGDRLYVCNGTQNAVAVIRFEPDHNASLAVGLIPVGWFPGAICFDTRRKMLCVANIKGLGALKVFGPAAKPKLNTKDFYGAVSLVRVPGNRQLAALTQDGFAEYALSEAGRGVASASSRPASPARPRAGRRA